MRPQRLAELQGGGIFLQRSHRIEIRQREKPFIEELRYPHGILRLIEFAAHVESHLLDDGSHRARARAAERADDERLMDGKRSLPQEIEQCRSPSKGVWSK